MSRSPTMRAYRDPDSLTVGRSGSGNSEEAVRRAEAEHGSAMLLLAINQLKQKLIRRELGL